MDSWELVRKIVGEDAVTPTTGAFRDPTKALREKHFEHAMRNQHPLARKQFLRGSRQFLEAQFLAVVEDEVRAHPIVAKIGSDYSNAGKVRGYVNILQDAPHVPLPLTLALPGVGTRI